MLELKSITRHVEIAALSVVERIDRIHDALYTLRETTLSLYETMPCDQSAVGRWLGENGFGFDQHGYFERLELLERARRGEVDPDEQIYYANAAIAQDPEALFRMYALQRLPRVLAAISERVPGMAWFYYQDVTGMVIVYPMHDPCTVVPPDFDWHAYHTYRLVNPESNPAREIRWMPPNIDYGGKGLMVAPSIPLYLDDEFFGVWSLDVPVHLLIQESLVESTVTGQQSFIVDRDGVLVAHASLETLIAPVVGDVYRKPMAELGGGFGTLDLENLWEAGQTRITDAGGTLCYVIARPVQPLDWLLVSTFPAQGVLEQMKYSFLDAFERAGTGDLSHRIDGIDDANMQGLVDGYNEMAAAVQATLEGKALALCELEASRDIAQAYFDAAPFGLCVLNMDGGWIRVNSELDRILGHGSQLVEKFEIVDLVPMELRGELKQLCESAISRGRAGPIESELKNADGQFIPVRVLASRLQQQGDVRVLLAVEDVTEMRRLQAQLLHNQKMEVIGKLAGGIAHDFNNILTAIMVNAGTLRDQVAEGSQAEKIISQIELVSKRAATLTSRLLTFSRRDILKPQVLDPVSIAKESKGFLKPLLDDNVKLGVSIDGKPPPVKCDAAQLLQVIMNVVINAGEALRGQGGKIALKIAPQRKAGCITGSRISITDNGPGIDDAIRARMFQPFVTSKAHGTGLGLATVRDIVTGAGGSIDVTSGPGQGTTFTFVLPAHSGGVRADQESPALLDLPVNGCVVIVDDEPLVREASARALEQAGIEVRVADGAESALAIIEELGNRAALLLTDVVMPHTGGRELAARAAEILPNLPVLYMTGYTDDTILLHGVEANSVELLRKPFSPQILVHAVKLTLARAAGR